MIQYIAEESWMTQLAVRRQSQGYVVLNQRPERCWLWRLVRDLIPMPCRLSTLIAGETGRLRMPMSQVHYEGDDGCGSIEEGGKAEYMVARRARPYDGREHRDP